MASKEYSRKYYLANREKFLAARKKYVSENRDKVLADKKLDYQKHKEKRDAGKKQWIEKNREDINARNRERYWKNRERERLRSKKYQLENKAKCNEKARRWRMNNKGRNHINVKMWRMGNKTGANAKSALHRAKKYNVAVPWANLEEIKRIYDMAALMTRLTGIEHHVDHVYPICGNTVTGLHVEHNLRVIPGRENQSKSNKCPCLCN